MPPLGLACSYANVPRGLVWIEGAVLLLTNRGSVPVRFANVLEAYGRSNIVAHLRSYPLLVPRTLAPGESAQAVLHLLDGPRGD